MGINVNELPVFSRHIEFVLWFVTYVFGLIIMNAGIICVIVQLDYLHPPN